MDLEIVSARRVVSQSTFLVLRWTEFDDFSQHDMERIIEFEIRQLFWPDDYSARVNIMPKSMPSWYEEGTPFEGTVLTRAGTEHRMNEWGHLVEEPVRWNVDIAGTELGNRLLAMVQDRLLTYPVSDLK